MSEDPPMTVKTFLVGVPHPSEELKAPKVVDCWKNRINNELNENLGSLHPDDAKTIITQLKNADPGTQGRHIFFETVLGGYFARSGYGPRYEQTIDGLTPDWLLTENPYRAIVEVANVDPSAEVTKKLLGESITFEGNRAERFYEAIREKKNKYKEVIRRKELPFVVAVCPSLAASLSREDFEDALLNDQYGIFLNSPHMSGVLQFESGEPQGKSSYAEHWTYDYWPNPNAFRAWQYRL